MKKSSGPFWPNVPVNFAQTFIKPRRFDNRDIYIAISLFSQFYCEVSNILVMFWFRASHFNVVLNFESWLDLEGFNMSIMFGSLPRLKLFIIGLCNGHVWSLSWHLSPYLQLSFSDEGYFTNAELYSHKYLAVFGQASCTPAQCS